MVKMDDIGQRIAKTPLYIIWKDIRYSSELEAEYDDQCVSYLNKITSI